MFRLFTIAASRLCAACSICLSLVVSSADAATFHVPGDWPTVQQAINAALPGDEIVIAPGTYNEFFDVTARHTITIRGAAGAEKTILDGGGVGGLGRQIARVQNGSTGIVFDGLTFRNCDPAGATFYEGPGIEIEYFVGGATLVREASQLTIQNCKFHDNELDKAYYAAGFPSQSSFALIGAAVAAIQNSSMTILDSSFENNKVFTTLSGPATHFIGGAIGWSGNGSFVVSGTEFTGNSSFGRAGAIGEHPTFALGTPFGNFVITNCVFQQNIVGSQSGGTTADSGAVRTVGWAVIADCQFLQNRVDDLNSGIIGALSLDAGAITNCLFEENDGMNAFGALRVGNGVTITGCVFRQNIVSGGISLGGAFRAGDSDSSADPVRFQDCEFIENRSMSSGGRGGVGYIRANVEFEQCTFSGNSANENGGVLYFESGSYTVRTIDCTFENNSTGVFGEGGVFYLNLTPGSKSPPSHTSIIAENCVFENNSAGNGGGVARAWMNQSSGMLTGSMSFINSTFRNNTAGASSSLDGTGGGGTDSAGSVFSLKDWQFAEFIGCTFEDNLNTAPSPYGAIHTFGNTPGTVRVSDSEFCGNLAAHLTGPWINDGGNSLCPLPTPLAYWNFNGPSTPVMAASFGSGQFSTSGWGGLAFYPSSISTTANAMPDVPAGSSLGLALNGVGTPIDITVSMTGQKDLKLSLASKCSSNSSYYTNGTWWWATGENPQTFTQMQGVDTAPTPNTNAQPPYWQMKQVDFSLIAAINNAETVTLRYIFQGSVGGGGGYIDNIQLNATPIPSPVCPADLSNDDGVVNVFDLFMLLSNWNTAGPGADLAEPNDTVNVLDLFVLLSAWGDC